MNGKKFLMGVATAATQIEGAYDQDGKGRTIWDEYSAKKWIKNGQTCFRACDCYNRLDEDIELLKELGVTSYRFSVAWSRIQPKGYGEINPKGIAYYNRLIDRLLENNIEPFVTLFHWDLPVELDARGGFLNREIVDRFTEYAKIVAQNFGDRVRYFSVFNEPTSLIDFLYMRPVGNVKPLGSMQEVFVAIHNLLLSNGMATRALREYSRSDMQIGIANVTHVKMPDDKCDEAVAKKAMFEVPKDSPFGNTTFLDPLVFGKYDENLLAAYNIDASEFVQGGDMEIIACKPDFLGCNIYLGERVSDDGCGNAIPAQPKINASYGDMGGDIADSADSMYYGTKFIYDRYRLPIYICENGVSLPEWKTLDGQVSDAMRSDYLRRYFTQFIRAGADGVDIRGYFVWTLLDNFEWSSGFTRRFGLVYVDYETCERTKKDSFYAYKNIISDFYARAEESAG